VLPREAPDVRGEEVLRELRLPMLRRHRQDEAQALAVEHALERLGDQPVVLRHVVARMRRVERMVRVRHQVARQLDQVARHAAGRADTGIRRAGRRRARSSPPTSKLFTHPRLQRP
jgi:hypothetical protein